MNTSNNDSLFRLDGKTALVTGAGAGIGRGIAEAFANAGASVIVVDIDQGRALETVQAIAERGGKASALAADISCEDEVIALFVRAPAVFGGLDILVNNAAIFPKKPFLEVDAAFWDRLHGVNLRGTFLCLREGIRRMREQGRGGSIVNISSVSSLQTAVYHNATYNASKAGVNSLTRTTALEFAADGIRVNAVLPGGVLTPGAKAATSAIEIKGPMTTPGRIPLGGMGDAADIAAATLFLAGPAARYVTGQLLAVDGGFQIG
jgi:NAD(P)-dependent dehydrogenase (short-subunit alcohol dehydrogenase family)